MYLALYNGKSKHRLPIYNSTTATFQLLVNTPVTIDSLIMSHSDSEIISNAILRKCLARRSY